MADQKKYEEMLVQFDRETAGTWLAQGRCPGEVGLFAEVPGRGGLAVPATLRGFLGIAKADDGTISPNVLAIVTVASQSVQNIQRYGVHKPITYRVLPELPKRDPWPGDMWCYEPHGINPVRVEIVCTTTIVEELPLITGASAFHGRNRLHVICRSLRDDTLYSIPLAVFHDNNTDRYVLQEDGPLPAHLYPVETTAPLT